MSLLPGDIINGMRVVEVKDPKIAHTLFSTTKLWWLWLIVRFYLGYQWFEAGWEKVQNPVWVGKNAGAAISGFVQGSLSKTSGPHPDVSGWYAWFLKSYVLTHPVFWSHLVAYGEVAVGVCLVIGAFTGIAAFFGLFMNMNYLFAGTVSTNPVLAVCAIFIILGWKVAGAIGIDAFLLPLFGTPWSPGSMFKK